MSTQYGENSTSEYTLTSFKGHVRIDNDWVRIRLGYEAAMNLAIEILFDGLRKGFMTPAIAKKLQDILEEM